MLLWAALMACNPTHPVTVYVNVYVVDSGLEDDDGTNTSQPSYEPSYEPSSDPEPSSNPEPSGEPGEDGPNGPSSTPECDACQWYVDCEYNGDSAQWPSFDVCFQECEAINTQTEDWFACMMGAGQENCENIGSCGAPNF